MINTLHLRPIDPRTVTDSKEYLAGQFPANVISQRARRTVTASAWVRDIIARWRGCVHRSCVCV